MAGDLLGEVFDSTEWFIDLQIPERRITLVRPGQHILFRLESDPGLIPSYSEGKVIHVTPRVFSLPSGNGVFTARARIKPGHINSPQPGMSVSAYVNTGDTIWLRRILGFSSRRPEFWL